MNIAMEMDIELGYIEKILQASEDNSRTSQSELLVATNTDRNNETQVEKFIFHMLVIRDLKVLECIESNFSYIKDNFGFFHDDEKYYLSNPDEPEEGEVYYSLSTTGAVFYYCLQRDNSKRREVQKWLDNVKREKIKKEFPKYLSSLKKRK